MANLSYVAIMSLDGFIEDQTGSFDWGEPVEEAHRFINELVRPPATFLYGRRLYETMMVWELDPSFAVAAPHISEFARHWQAADKIVYSRTLTAVPTRRTTLRHDFDPEDIRGLKAATEEPLFIGGANLAAHAFAADLVDECHLFVAPVSVGGGKPCLPVGSTVVLELQSQRAVGGGMVYLHYRCGR
jgi:dihydrofolate reductase